VQLSGFVISRVWQKNIYSLQTCIFQETENQLLSSIFADYISILSKLRRNKADIQGIWMDYQNKTLFL